MESINLLNNNSHRERERERRALHYHYDYYYIHLCVMYERTHAICGCNLKVDRTTWANRVECVCALKVNGATSRVESSIIACRQAPTIDPREGREKERSDISWIVMSGNHARLNIFFLLFFFSLIFSLTVRVSQRQNTLYTNGNNVCCWFFIILSINGIFFLLFSILGEKMVCVCVCM